MKTIATLTALALIVAFPHPGGTAEVEVGYSPKLTRQEDIESSFGKLGPMVAAIGKDAKFTLYEGLPHQTWNSEQLKEELKNKATVNRFGFAFYEAPNEISEEDAKALLAVIQNPKSFAKFAGFKQCGGFHPDFSLVWNDGNEDVEIHVCFGCHEIKAYRNEIEVYCDIPKDSYEILREILKKYKKQHP